MNILLTNPGRRTYIVSFLLELKELVNDLVIHLADCNEHCASKYVSRQTINHIVEPVLKNGSLYIKSIKNLCRENKIDVIIPLSDLDLYLLSIYKKEFKSIGCNVIVSDPTLIQNCFNKLRFHKYCVENNILTPPIITTLENYSGRLPIVKKHIYGTGSSGLKLIHTPKQFSYYNPSVDCIQPLIEGQEYGIDILNDLSGNFLSACVKKKILLRSGETDIAEVVDFPLLISFASKISSITKHIGNLDCDVIVDSKEDIYSIDFNPRIGGGYPATHMAGFNYLLAIINMCELRPVVLPASPNYLTVMKGISLHST